MEDLFVNLSSQNNQEFSQALEIFVNNYASVTKFEFLDKENFRCLVWGAIFSHLKNNEERALHEKCLATLRILSRDKTDLDNILTEDKLNVILRCAGLETKQEVYVIENVTNEAQKLLCNILFNSPKIQNIITETSCLETVVDRISKYDNNVKHDTKLFDVRIIFLITALNASTRQLVKLDLNGGVLLIEILENILMNVSADKKIMDNDAILACEILKALFNLFMQPNDSHKEESQIYMRIVEILSKLLETENMMHEENLQSNIVNLLTVIPSIYFSALITHSPENKDDNKTDQDRSTTIIDVLVEFLNFKLEAKSNLIENLTPVLTFFIRICRTERLVRKHVRMKVLPPLKDVMRKPEDGTTIRNRLCKLLTNPITEIRDLAAEFLFVLCKEKAGRMIKYTGYGNAAGMFANKGLLGPNHVSVEYSSDSEDSDTEEYEKYKDRINPITGCYEGPKSDPFENMTEDQKEYEALRLVNLVDQLQRGGIIQPCRVGEDGQPVPIEHVLELEEHLPKQQIRKRESK
ncbi:hypothetical protein QAD02_017852 [Eretmocerus hayati]|uniref:Uncharacterized protein n=1 Tax=Eretmocerus hayati TaxID=131215 RepID=A0ACC2PER2_9HYME|nr:hypothetical protein QAD02_017852 [Eretmocerus hayati]